MFPAHFSRRFQSVRKRERKGGGEKLFIGLGNFLRILLIFFFYSIVRLFLPFFGSPPTLASSENATTAATNEKAGRLVLLRHFVLLTSPHAGDISPPTLRLVRPGGDDDSPPRLPHFILVVVPLRTSIILVVIGSTRRRHSQLTVVRPTRQHAFSTLGPRKASFQTFSLSVFHEPKEAGLSLRIFTALCKFYSFILGERRGGVGAGFFRNCEKSDLAGKFFSPCPTSLSSSSNPSHSALFLLKNPLISSMRCRIPPKSLTPKKLFFLSSLFSSE